MTGTNFYLGAVVSTGRFQYDHRANFFFFFVSSTIVIECKQYYMKESAAVKESSNWKAILGFDTRIWPPLLMTGTFLVFIWELLALFLPSSCGGQDQSRDFPADSVPGNRCSSFHRVPENSYWEGGGELWLAKWMRTSEKLAQEIN